MRFYLRQYHRTKQPCGTSEFVHEHEEKKCILEKKQNEKHGLAGLCLTTSVCHAVEKEPGVGPGAIFDKAHVVAGVNAENGKQFHGAPGNCSVSSLAGCHC